MWSTPGDVEELPPWPRHWRNWHTVRDVDGLLTVVRPQQLELPAVMEASDEEGSFADEAQDSGAGAAWHRVHKKAPRVAFVRLEWVMCLLLLKLPKKEL